MKFDWLKTLVFSAAVIIAGFFIGNMHKIGKQYDRTVQVKGLSEREVDADLAVWPINISLTANDLNVLSGDIERQNKEVYNFFISQGFTEDELTKGSTNISDVRADRYNSNAQYSEFRYLAKSEFTVRTDDLGKLQKALSESLALMSKGILLESKNTWRPIEYIFTGLNDLKPSMIEEATKNAREVAEKFARDSDSDVGEIRTARQGLFTINDRDENTPQIKTVRVVTTIDFQLED
ncbi:SIMPL domain-containing protein [Cyclobacterium qasimii]|uniref:SIMPL domain-containing protein n=2 Tax=Cyclobacterium qasimii TaxID=1350429 RepID=A0A512C7U3_9BACT|nr:SIMPL domain-containing protein [Cyclobacterium qasimii]EPR71578.1 putative Periplasmic Protein [Cyclobacterium qasimii M12-11B]GEO20284.1 SIMPL domain-containing protein [Cyclobacterium qasimii]